MAGQGQVQRGCDPVSGGEPCERRRAPPRQQYGAHHVGRHQPTHHPCSSRRCR